MARTSKPKPKSGFVSEEDELPKEVKAFFFGNDSILSKEELLKRNDDFLKRCAERKLEEGKESIRSGKWFAALSKDTQEKILKQIFEYPGWNEKTDPSGTHGNGVIVFDGNYVVFAIREVDLTPPGVLMVEAPREVCLLIKHSSEI